MFNKIDIDLLCNFYLLQIMLAEKQTNYASREAGSTGEVRMGGECVEYQGGRTQSGCRFYGCPSFCPYEVV
jgi:hypothetical protein